MKLRRITSFFVAAIMALTCAEAVFPVTASAEMVNTDTKYSENFDGYENDVGYQGTLLDLKDYGWYMADNDTLYDYVTTVKPYSTYSYKLAKIVTKDESKCLMVVAAGEKNSSSDANVINFGYGKTFPGVAAGEAATGSWEIYFDFLPALVNKTTQFSFTLNTADGSASGEDARYNIISGYGQRFYLGYRDYKLLLNRDVKQGALKASEIGGVTWYRVKTILNCDAGYYSVELYDRATGALIARRSPISFDANNATIGFLKFSALGYSQDSYVYVDNISIEKIARDSLIYEDGFDYSDNSLATATISLGGTSEDKNGTSYFEGKHTPWLALGTSGKDYGLENDTDLGSQVLRLGDDTETQSMTEASGLVYMPVYEKLVTSDNQNKRGKVRVSFKIKPDNISDSGFQLKAIPDFNASLINAFELADNSGTPAIVTNSGNVNLDASKWYDAEVVLDAVNKKIATVLKEHNASEEIASFYQDIPSLTEVKGLLFNAVGGTTVHMDDFKLEYCMIAPSVDINNIVLTDRFGEESTDLNNVTTAVKTIEIPMGCPIDSMTANSSTILLKDSAENTVAYTGRVSGNSYIIDLNGVLCLNEEYTVTIPQTVASIFGDALGSNVIFTFRTKNAKVDISAVSVGGTPFSDLSTITQGSLVNVTLSYANSSEKAVNSKVMLAFYGENKLVDVQYADFTVAQSTRGTDDSTVAFTVPEDVDMDTVDSMSIFAWDGLVSIGPLSRSIKVERRIVEEGIYKDYVDFEVNIESGRDAVILQLTDPQIIDALQVREGVDFSAQKRVFWQPSLMNKRLFTNMRALIKKVNPDLILLTGDLVYGGYDDAGTSFTRLADFMDGFDIPWAPVFGNHDNESKMGVDWQCAYLESCKNCLFKQRTLTGNGNYSIGIVQGGELKRVIFMLDSNGCAVMSDESFANGHSKKSGGFGEDQIAWYTNSAAKINSDFENIKYTFAFHIQLAAFEDAFLSYGFNNKGATIQDGVGKGDFVEPINIDEREDKGAADFGYIGRKMKTPWDDDRTVYNGMKAIGADSILVGHEHCNSASVVYDGIRFQYGQKIGEYDRINFRTSEGKIVGYIAIESSIGTPVLGGTVMKLSEETGEISDAYIEYCSN